MKRDNSLETGKLPKEFKKKWVEALMSGEYKQGQGWLCNDYDAFCCLGIAEITAGKKPDSLYAKRYPCMLDNPKSPKLLHSKDNKEIQFAFASMNDNGIPFEAIAGFIQENL